LILAIELSDLVIYTLLFHLPRISQYGSGDISVLNRSSNPTDKLNREWERLWGVMKHCEFELLLIEALAEFPYSNNPI